MTTTCKTCKYKGTEPTDPSNLKDLKYTCYVHPPEVFALLVPENHGVRLANVNAYPQVNNDTPSCRHYSNESVQKL